MAAPATVYRDGAVGSPRFLGNPHVSLPCSPTPADLRTRPNTVRKHGPRIIQRRGLPTRGDFGAQSHGLDTGCLRFAQWVAPQDARLASGCWPALPGGISLPTEFLRKVLDHSSPFPKLPGAMNDPFRHGCRPPFSAWMPTMPTPPFRHGCPSPLGHRCPIINGPPINCRRIVITCRSTSAVETDPSISPVFVIFFRNELLDSDSFLEVVLLPFQKLVNLGDRVFSNWGLLRDSLSHCQ